MTMKTIEETYREKLALLIEEFGSAAALGNVIDKSPSQISQWLNGSPDSKTGKSRSMKPDTAREIEKATGKPYAWFDQPVYTLTIGENNNGNQNVGSGNQINYSLYQESGADLKKLELGETDAKYLKSMPLMDINLAARYLIDPEKEREQIYDNSERAATFIPHSSDTIGIRIADDGLIDFSKDRITAGDILIVEPKIPPRDGDLILLCLNNTGYWRGMICRLSISIDGKRMIKHSAREPILIPKGALIGGVIVELKRRLIPTDLLASRLDHNYDIKQSEEIE